ncbi:MAG: AraC family transcriptional regulator [Nevskia sp.]|nr:AraC family transcriptional regulator [Nevskia sp.]
MLDRSGEAVFAAVLRAHQLRAHISMVASYCDNWTDPEPACEFGTFHLIDSGVCWLRAPVLEAPVRLGPGDLVIFPQGTVHVLSSAADGSNPGETRFTTMLCGEFEFATGKRNPIIDGLPACLVVREQDSGMQFRRLAQLMMQEAQGQSFGSRTVIDKLADAMFVMAVRHHIERAAERRGLLAALLDARLARALEAIHERPGRDWTVAALADVAHMSRTAFSERFSEVLATSPIEYLTQWRMTEAARLLCDPRLSVAAVAERLGYQTEAAFRRAFKRIHGFGPGQVRRRLSGEELEDEADDAAAIR